MPLEIEVNEAWLRMEYAVRGPIPQRAAELEKEGRDIVWCNIGNPHQLGQPPITFIREVVSLVSHPYRIVSGRKLKRIREQHPEIFEKYQLTFDSDYVLDLSERILKNMRGGMGAYSESQGTTFIRNAVAAYIDRRDGVNGVGIVPANPDNISLINGASEGISFVIGALIGSKNDGILIPIPQYPLFAAEIIRKGGRPVGYYLDEDSGWTFGKYELEDAYQRATAQGIKLKGIVAINPGNPAGYLSRANIEEIVEFAGKHGLIIIADEVYQRNTYGNGFTSFASVVGSREVALVSFNSPSKGYLGECGCRGGYFELRNSPRIKGENMDLSNLLRKPSAQRLCSNTAGQVVTYLMVDPPEEVSEPYDQFRREKDTILKSLHERALMIRKAFDDMEGVQCFGKIGALYLFPRLQLPKGTDDFQYCMALLEDTGLCTVNGAGFGQREGTNHLRTTFLPQTEVLQSVLPRWIEFHNQYVKR